MGTRSTTRIYEGEELLLSLYKQFDGYTEGWGTDLKNFLKSGYFVNGIPFKEKHMRLFNGAGDFALQLVKEFKEGAGGLYATTEDDRQEYNYVLKFDNKTPHEKVVISCEEDDDYYEEINLEEKEE